MKEGVSISIIQEYHSRERRYNTFNTEASSLVKLLNFEMKGKDQVSKKTTKSIQSRK